MFLDATAAAAAADLLYDARRSKSRIDALPESCRPVSEADGYAVQAILTDRMLADGSVAVGYKIGATNPAARAMLETSDPFSAVLVSELCHRSPVQLDASDFHVIILEPEIALRLGHDLPGAEGPYTPESVAAAVEAVVPAIEIVTSPFPVWNQAGIGSLIADLGANGCWIHGDPVPDPAALDLSGTPVTLSINGAVVAEGAGRNVDGGPMVGLAWLANHLNATGRMLEAGAFVTTGSTTTPTPAQGGQDVVADFGRLGQCRVTLV